MQASRDHSNVLLGSVATPDTSELVGRLRTEFAASPDPDFEARLGLPVWRDLLIAALPERLGGLGLADDPERVNALFDVLIEIGAVDLSAARLYEAHVNATRLVLVHGDGPLVTAMADAVRAHGLLGVWGANGTEPLCMIRTSDCVRLSGGKRFASGLGQVSHAILTARDEDRAERMVFAPVLDPARHDPHGWTASAMRDTVSGGFDATGIELPGQAVMGGPGALMTEPHFEGGIWRYCAAHVGGAKGLIAEWARLLTKMGRADDPIQRSRLGQALAAIGAARAYVLATAHRVECSVGRSACDIRDAVAQALLAREATSTACVEVLRLCEASLGMAAHDGAGPIDRRRRDLSLFLRQAAPDDKLDRAVAVYLEALK